MDVRVNNILARNTVANNGLLNRLRTHKLQYFILMETHLVATSYKIFILFYLLFRIANLGNYIVIHI